MTHLHILAAASALAWSLAAGAQPAITPDLPTLNLDRLGLYSVGYGYRGQPEQPFPLGWSGQFEDQTGVACAPFGTQHGKEAFLLHCPWRNGTGVAFQQFVFRLPAQATRIRLRGATALRSENVTNSDGVTFRLYLNGARQFDYHQTNDTWRPFEVDLTPQRGSNATIRFEVDPGPRHNASFDFSLWGERQLVLEGYAPKVVTHPPPPALALSNLWSGLTTDVAPPSGFPAQSASSFSNGAVHLRYAGPDGTLDYEWRAPQSTNDPLFGSLLLHAQMTGDQPATIPLANAATLTWAQPARPLESRWLQAEFGWTLLRAFQLGSTTATVRITGRLAGKTLALTVASDQPGVAAFDPGVWGPVVHRRALPVPYYSGTVFYLAQEGLFVNTLLDWTQSAATSHNGTKANYEPRTDGSRVPLRERALFTAAWHLAEVLPNPPNPPSPWREFLANQVVLDIWGGRFTNVAAHLATLADYGITPGIALIHDWQRSGYDNALPAHYPANAAYGGDPGMQALVATGARLGIRCALHENYVDYYPNYEGYRTNDLALDAAGRPQLAWYNPGTRIQSFAIKPNAILPLAASQSPEIHRRYHSAANYLDVHSSVPPWFHVDSRAGETGAGQFSRVWETHRELWAYERTTHGGPVFGEGNNHWYWSGCLDGVEAQFGSGWPGNGGFTAPLAVDFDLLKLHPLQFNHGMGYLSRWWPSEAYATNWGGGPAPMVVLDRYRVQEVAYGHAGFLDGSVYATLPLAWLEHHLLAPVMARYATARPIEIRYQSNGGWLDATAAAKLDQPGATCRLRVRYENGLVITANGSAEPWSVGPWRLPPWGWVAEGAGLTAGTVLRDGTVADFVDTQDTLFFNARAASDWNLSTARRVAPKVDAFQSTGARAARVTYRWEVQDRLPLNYVAFVHFCTQGTIRAQQDHPVSLPTSNWQPGQTVHDGPYDITLPSHLPDGDYDWLIGLHDAHGDGGRAHLQGIDDGSARIRLGVLHLAGPTLTFTAETNYPSSRAMDWYSQHLNASNRVVNFDTARTDGSAWLRREGNLWRLQTWPRERPFTLEFNRQRLAAPASVACRGGAAPTLMPVATDAGWRLPLNGASEYFWTNAPAPQDFRSK